MEVDTDNILWLCSNYLLSNFSSIQYKGPALSVACVQEFKGDLYVCYNGSELRRFDLKVTFVLKYHRSLVFRCYDPQHFSGSSCNYVHYVYTLSNRAGRG